MVGTVQKYCLLWDSTNGSESPTVSTPEPTTAVLYISHSRLCSHSHSSIADYDLAKMSEQKEKLTYLAGGPDGKVQVKTALRAMSGLEVLIKVTHSGVCGTDGHDRTAGCGLGHEGAGLVEKIGKEVTALKVGQRVGWG